MATHGKRYTEQAAKVDETKSYAVVEAFELLIELSKAGFDQTVDLAVNLGVDPRHGEQMVRGTTNLPNGTGKTVKVAVFARGDNAVAAEEAGADTVGAEDLIAKIQEGWRDFDTLVATPDLIPQVAKLGRLLGPKMPNAKSGTVTTKVGEVVADLKKSRRVGFRVEKAGIVHMPIGKVSFGSVQLIANFRAAINALLKAKPATAKGRYVKHITISASMGPGINIDALEAAKVVDVTA
ncbi:MAG: 50S ribosomal protein L1 [Armatimonadota bacterium]